MTTEDFAPAFFLEAHFVCGLAPFVMQELQEYLKSKLRIFACNHPGIIRFGLIDDLTVLNKIRTVTAFYVGRHYSIPRPKALLGHAHCQQLLKQLALVLNAYPYQPFRTFRIDAAGSESSVFRRLSQEIAKETALVNDPEDGELLIRVFPTDGAPSLWAVLCRLTPRPLSARQWRVVDHPGALNATVAAAMNLMSRPQPTDCFLNLMCGSGTLLIERLLLLPTLVATGCDTSISALAAAEANLNAAGLSGQIMLLNEDATQLPFPAQSFDRLVADLPWGHLIGAHTQNKTLYPLLLKEAARVAMAGASFVLITTEIRLFEETLRREAQLWRLCEMIKLAYKELRPRLYCLQRSTFAARS
jgi:ubiquinone/menaquinone biosynthesis C-methylase UbiE